MVNKNSCEDFCPVSKAMIFISKKWSIEIIRDIFFGKKRFKEFNAEKPNLSNKVLSDCLKNLEQNGIIEKRIINSSPISTEYYLTKQWESLNRVIYELAIFALENSDDEAYNNESQCNQIKQNFKDTLMITD